MSGRVLLTGGTGFVGANLARRLLATGHEVHLLVRPEYDAWRLAGIASDVRLHVVDFADAPALTRTVAALEPRWAFHLAAHGAYSWQQDTEQIVRTNFVGTVNLVQSCLAAGVEAFINTGSSSEYGPQDHAPTETEALDPNSCYAVTKAAATMFCRHVARSEGKNLITLRLYSAYGAYEDPRRLIPRLVAEGLEGRLPPLVNPQIARDFVHVEDVCDAYLAALQPGLSPGAVYNVGTGVQTTVGEAVAVAQRVLGLQVEPQWGSMPDRGWDTSIWVADSTRARTELGWTPRWDFETGFRQTVAWLQAHPELRDRYRQPR